MNTPRDRIKLIRKTKGLSQQKLAEVLNFKLGPINSIENGTQKSVPFALAKALNEVFGYNIEWVIDGIGEMYDPLKNTLEIRYADVLEGMQTFGKRLQKIQLKNDFSDEQIAKIIDISLKRYLELCVENKEPTTKELLNIKENFDVTLDWLLFGDESNTNNKVQDTLAGLGFSENEIIKLRKILNKG